MQLIKLESCSILKQKLIDVRVVLEDIEKRLLENVVPERCPENGLRRIWHAIAKKYFVLKTLQLHYSPYFHLHMLVSLYSSVMNFIKSRNRNSLTDETGSSCMSLKVTKYKPDVTSLSAVMQQQKSHCYLI